jgi:hypothetical protein
MVAAHGLPFFSLRVLVDSAHSASDFVAVQRPSGSLAN